MDRKEFEDKIKEIGTCEDEVRRRELLTELNDGAVEVFDNNETLKTENEEYKTKNERLTESNRNYFERLQSQRTQEESDEDSTGMKKEEKKEYKSYDEIVQGFRKKL